MAKRLYLIRHGDTEGTVEGRLLGSTDQPLSARGAVQVQRLAELLGASLVRAGLSTWCVSSPLLRAQETARVVSGRIGSAVSTDPDLREMDFGVWEGLTADEIEARFPGEQTRWESPTSDTAFPDGESLGEFEERVARARDRIVRRSEDAVLVFTHGGVVRELMCELLGLGRESYWLFSIRPASVARIDLFGEGAVKGAVLAELWSTEDREGE